MPTFLTRTFTANTVLPASDVRQIVDNFILLDQHAHTGAAGDGASTFAVRGTDHQIMIFPRFPASNTGFTFSASNTVVTCAFASSTAQNDQLTWPVGLHAGTYRLDIIYSQASNRGIATFYLDASSIGTVDMYNAASTDNITGAITGISVASSAWFTLKMKMETKNASSSAYTAKWAALWLRRTA